MSANTTANTTPTAAAEAAAVAAVTTALANPHGPTADRAADSEPPDVTIVQPSPAGNTVAVQPSPAGNTVATDPHFVGLRTPITARGFIEQALLTTRGNRVFRRALVQHLAEQFEVPFANDTNMVATLRSVLAKLDQNPIAFTLAPPAWLATARMSYPYAAHLFPEPGLDDDAFATLTEGITLPEEQLELLRHLTPDTVAKIWGQGRIAHDDRSVADSLTINTVDYGTVDANASYPTRAQLVAAATTTVNLATNVPSPAYPPPGSDIASSEEDPPIDPHCADRKRAALPSPNYQQPASASTGTGKLKGLCATLALYRSWMLHEQNPTHAYAHFPPLPDYFESWNPISKLHTFKSAVTLISDNPPNFLRYLKKFEAVREPLKLDPVIAAFFLSGNWDPVSYEDHDLANMDLTAKLTLLSFLPRRRTAEATNRHDEIVTNQNAQILGHKQTVVSKAATSLPAAYQCTEPRHVGIAIYNLITMAVAITGPPNGCPIPLKPLIHICASCYDTRFSANNTPALEKQNTALFLLQLGQKQLCLLLEYMSHLPIQGKAQAKQTFVVPKQELSKWFDNAIKATETDINSFHPRTAYTHPLPDLSRYLSATLPTEYSAPQLIGSPYQHQHFTQQSRYSPDDVKRSRFQEPPPGPPALQPGHSGGGDPPTYRQAATPFIAIRGNRKQTLDTMRKMNSALRANNYTSTPCIAYTRIGGRGCSKPNCGYGHFEFWANMPRTLQTALAAWESDCPIVTINKPPAPPGR